MSTYTLSINCPQVIRKVPWGLLSANTRHHWSVNREVARYWRQVAAFTARNAGVPRVDRGRVVVTFHKATNRRFDPGNLSPVSKAILDGIVDAGVFEDDSHEYVIGPDHRAGTKSSTPHVVIEITELGDTE